MCKRLSHGGTTANLYELVPNGLIRMFILCISEIFIFPHKLGKSASSILEPLYPGFVGLSNHPDGENIQLNNVLYQGAASGSLLASAYKRMLSIIISKIERTY